MNNSRVYLNYLLFGALTTFVNMLTYGVLTTKALDVDYQVATTIAWILSVITAFITNKKYVFKSNLGGKRTFLSEFFYFVFFD